MRFAPAVRMTSAPNSVRSISRPLALKNWRRTKFQSAVPPPVSRTRTGASNASAKVETALGWTTRLPFPFALTAAFGGGGVGVAVGVGLELLPPHAARSDIMEIRTAFFISYPYRSAHPPVCQVHS